MKRQGDLLGSHPIAFEPFPSLDTTFQQFHNAYFRSLSFRKKFERVNRVLLSLVQEASEPCFLLPCVIDFIERVNREKLLREPLRMAQVEFWLNHFSQISDEENLHIRSKIVGKKLPREEYQAFFPIGMNKTFSGSHFVAAHLSPDVDTTIASFWGWVDAFGCRLASGIHQWSLPGRLPDSHTTLLFQTLFSPAIFETLVRTTPNLTLTALDLISKKDIVKVRGSDLSHQDLTKAGRPIIVVDSLGHFIGDWRAQDAESVRQVVVLFYSLIRWLENAIHFKLISAFAEKKVQPADIKSTLKAIFDMNIKACEPAKEFAEKQKRELNDFLKKVLDLPKGLLSTFRELAASLEKKTSAPISSLQAMITNFDDFEERPKIFKHLEKIFHGLDHVIQMVRAFVDRFDVLLEIKDKVLEIPSYYITLNSDVEEIRTKMANFEHLTVLIPEEEGAHFPVGVVYAQDLKRSRLGTVSLRDFSSEAETKMASYLEVISVIDHHKSDIKTSSASTIVVGDAQSANTIVAELVLRINSRYSTQGIREESLQKTLQEALKEATHDPSKLKRLLELKLNYKHQGTYFIHPIREFTEYLLFLSAILDDTDLLTKVSHRDLECVASLLNRMKSIASGKECQIIRLDDIPRDKHFTQVASSRILQNEELYSIYKKSHSFKEKEVEENVAQCISGDSATIFANTKEQNGCCRVGQTKMFSTNVPLFEKYGSRLQAEWLKIAEQVFETRREIDLHMQMISTCASAEEVFKGKTGKWSHKDEIWIYIPMTQSSIEHLVYFLNSFQATDIAQKNAMVVEFLGPNCKALEQIFMRNFPKASRRTAQDCDKGLPIAILRFDAGLINSRKALITPHLPRAIS